MVDKASSGPRGGARSETPREVLHAGLHRRLPLRTAAQGELIMPAAPALIDYYIQILRDMFQALGRMFTGPELEHLKGVLLPHMAAGFERSPTARLKFSYATDPPPKTTLSYNVEIIASTIADEYDHWVKFREPPLFGTHPDAKVVKVARSLGAPADVRILDVGAGTGRNTLPLAREGFRAEALELAPALAEVLRNDAATQGLDVRVFVGDMLDRSLGVPEEYYNLLIMAEVIASHCRGLQHMRRFFERAAEVLAPGGVFLFSTFVTAEGFRPTELERQLGECFWTTLCSRKELSEAMADLPFQRLTDEPVFEFEQQNLPKDNWPPTGWFVSWVNGLDLFEVPQGRAPAELRWLVYRRT